MKSQVWFIYKLLDYKALCKWMIYLEVANHPLENSSIRLNCLRSSPNNLNRHTTVKWL